MFFYILMCELKCIHHFWSTPKISVLALTQRNTVCCICFCCCFFVCFCVFFDRIKMIVDPVQHSAIAIFLSLQVSSQYLFILARIEVIVNPVQHSAIALSISLEVSGQYLFRVLYLD